MLRGSHVIYFRNQGEDAEGSLADVVHQTAMYYEDRLQGAGFSRVLLAGAAAVPGGGDALRRNLEERVGVKVEPVDPRGFATLQDRISAAPELARCAGAADWHPRPRGESGLTMLRTNLSTRPFYNERPIRLGIAAAVIAVAAFTAFNSAQVMTLTQKNNELTARADAAEARASDLRNKAGATQKSLDRGDVSVVQAAAREANLLIDRRAFSWTDLFNRFEETLPADVRISAVQPQLDDQERMLVAMTVVSRRVEDLDAFIDRLEQTKVFQRRAASRRGCRGRRHAAVGHSGLLHADRDACSGAAWAAATAVRACQVTAEASADVGDPRHCRGPAGPDHPRAPCGAPAARPWS